MTERRTYNLSTAAKERVASRLRGKMDETAGYLGPLGFADALAPENPGSPTHHYIDEMLVYLRDTGNLPVLWALALAWGRAWAEARIAYRNRTDANARMLDALGFG